MAHKKEYEIIYQANHVLCLIRHREVIQRYIIVMKAPHTPPVPTGTVNKPFAIWCGRSDPFKETSRFTLTQLHKAKINTKLNTSAAPGKTDNHCNINDFSTCDDCNILTHTYDIGTEPYSSRIRSLIISL